MTKRESDDLPEPPAERTLAELLADEGLLTGEKVLLTDWDVADLLRDPEYQEELKTFTDAFIKEHLRACPGCSSMIHEMIREKIRETTPPHKHRIIPIQTKDADKVPKPVEADFENSQIDLFQRFLCNTDQERDRLSNLIDFWDNVPRYFVSRQKMQTMMETRIDGRFLEELSIEFNYEKRAMTATLYPARVLDADGVSRDFYASANEEIIEDALRKLSANQQAGYVEPKRRSGVAFSLYALRKELEKRGHTRSYPEIILSLNILSGSIIEIRSLDGKFFSRSTYLPFLAAVSQESLFEDSDARWVVQFHPLVTSAIDHLQYRQYNYALMMSHSTQLARWLHKYLALKYTAAASTTPFEIQYSTIKRSGMLDGHKTERKAVVAVEKAFIELKKNNVLRSFGQEKQRGPRGKILGIKYTMLPTEDFVRDAKASNKRSSDAQRASARLPEKR